MWELRTRGSAIRTPNEDGDTVKVRKAASGDPAESPVTPGFGLEGKSEAGLSLQDWVELAQNAPEMRANRVESLRCAVRHGRYFVSTEQLVEALAAELYGHASSAGAA